MNQTAERNFHVNYYEKEEGKNIWIVESHLTDGEHDITTTVEIDMDIMVITNAKISFARNPLDECRLMEKKAEQLIGIKVDTMFSRRVMQLFMGPEGCPNIMTLLQVAIPGIMYYYYSYKISKGDITKEQFFDILKEKERNACLAHTIHFAETSV